MHIPWEMSSESLQQYSVRILRNREMGPKTADCTLPMPILTPHPLGIGHTVWKYWKAHRIWSQKTWVHVLAPLLTS